MCKNLSDMGGVAVLHPQDVLKDRFKLNRMPLIDSLKSQNRNPNRSQKSVVNANRRKRSPQKKINDVPRISLVKGSNPGNNGKGKVGNGNNLVMGKVTILKRGEALNNDENIEKKLLFDKENREKNTVLFDKEIKKEEKMVLFDKQIKNEKKIGFFDKDNKNEKKIVLFDKENKEMNTSLFDKEIKNEKKIVFFDKENKNEKKVLFDKENDNEKKIVFFDKENKNEKKIGLFDVKIKEVLSKNEDMKRRIEDSEAIEMLLRRLGPEPAMLPKFYYAGSVVDSPSPRCLPVPSFLAAAEPKDDYASSNFRRLLKLRGFEMARAG